MHCILRYADFSWAECFSEGRRSITFLVRRRPRPSDAAGSGAAATWHLLAVRCAKESRHSAEVLHHTGNTSGFDGARASLHSGPHALRWPPSSLPLRPAPCTATPSRELPCKASHPSRRWSSSPITTPRCTCTVRACSSCSTSTVLQARRAGPLCTAPTPPLHRPSAMRQPRPDTARRPRTTVETALAAHTPTLAM